MCHLHRHNSFHPQPITNSTVTQLSKYKHVCECQGCSLWTAAGKFLFGPLQSTELFMKHVQLGLVSEPTSCMQPSILVNFTSTVHVNEPCSYISLSRLLKLSLCAPQPLVHVKALRTLYTSSQRLAFCSGPCRFYNLFLKLQLILLGLASIRSRII